MVERLRNNKGDGSVYPIILVIMVSLISIMVIMLAEMDNYIQDLQKQRYSKAVDMAVNTAMATIELSTDTQEYNPTTPEAQAAYDASNYGEIGLTLREGVNSLESIALGYTLDKNLMIDKERFTHVFYNVLFRNFQTKLTDSEKIKYLKKYVPLKAIIEYDTMYISTYEEKNPDDDKYEDDIWQAYRLQFTSDTIYMTLSDKCYTVDTSMTLEDRFKEENRIYFSVLETNSYNIDQNTKNKELVKAVQRNLETFVNLYKQNHYDYQIQLRPIEETKFVNVLKDVTFFCIVEGLPVKSMFSKEPNYSYYEFKFGGASLKRADQ